MHTLITADVAREIVADRLRDAEERRRAGKFTRRPDRTTAPLVRRSFARLLRPRAATA